MSRRLVIGIAVAVVVLAALVVGVVGLRSGADAPPDKPTGADVFRVKEAQMPSGGQRAATPFTYGGHSFTVSVGLVSDRSGGTAEMLVTGPGRSYALAEYKVGQRIEFDGCALKLVDVYRGPKTGDDLVDLRVLSD